MNDDHYGVFVIEDMKGPTTTFRHKEVVRDGTVFFPCESGITSDGLNYLRYFRPNRTDIYNDSFIQFVADTTDTLEPTINLN
jgi:hypothetical protein